MRSLSLGFVVGAVTAKSAWFEDYLKASGIEGASTSLGNARDPPKSKYDNPGNTLKAFTDVVTDSGTYFSGVFSDHAVLQREPAQAAVYGVVLGAQSGTAVDVTFTDVDQNAASKIKASVNIVHDGYAHWKAVLPATKAGGNFTISADCSGCAAPGNSSTIMDVTFGDVWFCSGQSNMWLPMNMDSSRNSTYDAILRGKYQNIRMKSMPHNNQPDGGYKGYDLDIAPPPPAWNPWGGDAGGGWLLTSVGTYANKTCREGGGDHGCRDPTHCCTGYPQPNQDWVYNSVNQFSAACWHFAEHLTDIAEANNETIVPYGLISSQWGGTLVEHWIPNATLNAGACKNNSGGAYAPWQNNRWDIDSGGLYNGMVRPFLNMSIKGALWYQGENNVFQCHDAGSNEKSNSGKGGGPYACGNVKSNEGYACMLHNLVDTWREGFGPTTSSTTTSTTTITPSAATASAATITSASSSSSSLLPMGVVTLAGGTSEGHGPNMGAFRYAQSGNAGVLPTADMPATFSAQAHDAGDPCAGGSQCCENSNEAQSGWACKSGEAPYTAQFMGGIHPRVKKIVGTRLAKAARALVYGDDKQMWTGPVLRECSLEKATSTIKLKFDSSLLKSDSVMVLDQANRAISLETMSETIVNWDDSITLKLLEGLGGESALQVQINGSPGNLTSGTWLSVKLQTKCQPPGIDEPNGRPSCSWNTTTGTHTDGFDEVTALVPGNIDVNITGIRYAWGENPCCPGVNRFIIPCPPNSCPIQTYNSTLPAVPFWATLGADGKCDWISTKDGAITE